MPHPPQTPQTPQTPGKRGAPRIVVLAGGGVMHTSGGVGTLMLYLMEEWAALADAPTVRVIDTRGQGGVLGGVARFVGALATLLWLGLSGQLSLVHAHMTTRGSAVRKGILCSLASLLGRPTVVHMHGADFMAFYAGLHPLYRRLIGGVLRRAGRVVVLGEAWRRFLIDDVGVAAERVAIVMNGVKPPSQPATHRANPSPSPSPSPSHSPGPTPSPSHSPGPGPVRLLFLGRLGARKGVPELIEALADPALRDRAWVATLAGDGDVAGVRASVARLGLAARVAVPGWVDRDATAALLAAAEILVLPSHHEAMPIAVIEALAHRVAVVTTPVGVIPEVLTDGVDALLVPPGAPAALAAALVALIDDPARRQALAAAGHGVFLGRFDIRQAAIQLLDIYRALLAGAPPGGTNRGPAGSHPPHAPAGRRTASVALALADVQSLIDRINPVSGPEEVAALIGKLAAPDRPTIVSFVNQHALNVAWQNPEFAGLLARADLLLRDGVGIGMCMRVLGLQPGVNMNGTDFIPVLGAAHAGRRVVVFGTRQPWLDQAAAALSAIGCNLVQVVDGFQPDEAYVAAVEASQPDLLILAMGMPKQERVAAAVAKAAQRPMTIVNGGAIADFLAGRFPRAPRWARRLGLEWAFRLFREPLRLWQRYVTGGVMFMLRLVRLRLAVRDRAVDVLPGPAS